MNNKFINKLKFFLKKKTNNKLQINIENLLNKRLKQKKPLKINEEKIISNVFQLPEKLINDIMIPRTDIISVDTNVNINKLVQIIGRTSHSRYPVFDKSRDNIIGMIHIKDVISCWKNKKIRNIKKLVRQILFTPDSINILDLLLKMRTSHIHMAIIVDEHGGVDGLVTIEDLVEEIVGEIKDEHEAQKENKNNIKGLIKDDGSIKISARMLIEDFEKYQEEEKKRLEGKEIEFLVRPCKLQIMKGYIFRQNNPAVVGVDVLEGKIKVDTPLMKKNGEKITEIKSIQKDQENLNEVEKGKQVAVSLPKVTVGRQINEGDILYSAVPEEDFRKLKELKKYLSEKEKAVLKEIAQIMREKNPVWGI